MAEAGFLARLRARLLGDDAPDPVDAADPGEGGVIVSGDGDLDIGGDDGGGISGGDPVLQGGPTVLEHPDISQRLGADPDPSDAGDSLPDDPLPQDAPDEEIPTIDGPPPPPDLTGRLDADPDTSGPGVRYDLDLDLEAEAPFDSPDTGPQLDLDPDALGGGLDAPTITPGFDLDPVPDPVADFDDLA